MKYLNHLLVFLMAAVALVFSTGCNFDLWANATGYDPDADEPYIVVRCNPDTKTLQAYTTNYPVNIPGYVSGETQVASPINGKSCSVSTENQNRPFTISQAVANGIFVPPTSNAPLRTAAASAPSLVNTFPWLEPLLFGPAFPVMDHGKGTVNCPAGLEAYLVNHVEGTVTAFSICSMQVLKEITVTPDPLQVAVTPDGKQALVTSYDGAVTFIDTATNTISGTLVLNNYNPSGIAISSDSTRAYVTHYLDLQPSLLVIDIPNRKLLSTIPLPQAYPRVVVLTPDGSQAWVNYYQGSFVTIVDLLTGTVSGSVGGAASTGMAFNPTGTKAFLAVPPNLLYVVDTATLSTVARLTVGDAPSDVVATPDGKHVLVTSQSQPGTWWVDPRTNKVLGNTVPTGQTTGGSQGLLVFH